MHFISLGKLFQSIGAKCWKALFPFEVLMRDGDKENQTLLLFTASKLSNLTCDFFQHKISIFSIK